jgi:hypothetical protein
MLFGTYGWYLTDPAPGGAGSPWGLWLTANVLGYVILSILAFIWPLLGVHRVLDAQRSQLLEANMEKVRLAATETHRLLTSREYDGMAPLKNAMDSLAAERTNLRELSTWPWQVETVRLVSTAVFLPIVVYLLEKVLLVLLGG